MAARGAKIRGRRQGQTAGADGGARRTFSICHLTYLTFLICHLESTLEWVKGRFDAAGCRIPFPGIKLMVVLRCTGLQMTNEKCQIEKPSSSCRLLLPPAPGFYGLRNTFNTPFLPARSIAWMPSASGYSSLIN